MRAHHARIMRARLWTTRPGTTSTSTDLGLDDLGDHDGGVELHDLGLDLDDLDLDLDEKWSAAFGRAPTRGRRLRRRPLVGIPFLVKVEVEVVEVKAEVVESNAAVRGRRGRGPSRSRSSQALSSTALCA